MSENDPAERRQFHRVPFAVSATVSDDSDRWRCQVVDISLKGILMELQEDWPVKNSNVYRVLVHLGDNSEITICVDEATVAHIGQDKVGLRFSHMDIDSVAHLKRLMALNLGDSELLQRDLSALINHSLLP